MKDNKYIDSKLYTTYIFNQKNPYYLSIPKESFDTYELYISFPNNNNKTKIKELNDILIKTNPKVIHLICNLNREEIDEFSTYNDNKTNLYKMLQKKIYKMLANTYDFLKKKNLKIALPVKMIKQDDSDTKLINWLEIDDKNLFKGIKYQKIKNNYNELIFSGTKAIPFINIPKENNTKVKKLSKNSNGYSKICFIIIATAWIIIGISIFSLIIK